MEENKKKRSTTVNSSESLLVIYILRILKQYSSAEAPLTANDVVEHLVNDGLISEAENQESSQKKVRRLLDTLHSSYCNGCIGKKDGKPNKWYYISSLDKYAGEEGNTTETLTEIEIGVLVDLLSSTKILNSNGTRGLIDKLLKKTSLSDEDRMRRLNKIQAEEWFKTPNEDLAEKKAAIEECIDYCNIVFDYENEESITATPLRWSVEDGICFLDAMVGGKHRKFSLDKIRNYYGERAGYEDPEDYRPYDKETDSDKTSLDSLFVNIPTINKAISDKKCINFLYRSYKVSKGQVAFEDNEKSVLPRYLTFNDGKYYLIGIDVSDSEFNEIVYFRVDLMFEVRCLETKVKLSGSKKHDFDAIERARVVENHPLMISGKNITVTFKVIESALDRVVDAFGRNVQFQVTKETKAIPINNRTKKWYEKYSDEELKTERIVKAFVRTTGEEAFYWALANAGAVELIYPLELRYRLRRIAAPIQRSYVTTKDDQIRENVDRICESGEFNLIRYPEDMPVYESGSFFSTPFHIGEELAYESFKVLSEEEKLDVVEHITIWHNDADKAKYLGFFKNTIRVEIANSPCKNPEWISEISGLLGISIDSTSIENVCWLKWATKLQNVILKNSPISDLSVLRDHDEISGLELINIDISDIGFIEKFQHLYWLTVKGCPIRDYSPLLKIPALQHLEIDENVVESLGIENIRKHHPNADISVQPTLIN